MTRFAMLLASAGLAWSGVADALVKRDPPRHHRHHRHPSFHSAVASWYSYAGAVQGACGALRPNGVASRTLPCWTRLVICARQCVSALVDDRGPFVYSRQFDLSESLAVSVGFDLAAGVGLIRWRLAWPS